MIIIKLKIKQFIRQLLCHHEYHIIRWHYTHGVMNNNPPFIEGLKMCAECGKRKYFYCSQSSKLGKYIMTCLQGRQW